MATCPQLAGKDLLSQKQRLARPPEKNAEEGGRCLQGRKNKPRRLRMEMQRPFDFATSCRAWRISEVAKEIMDPYVCLRCWVVVLLSCFLVHAVSGGAKNKVKQFVSPDKSLAANILT